MADPRIITPIEGKKTVASSGTPEAIYSSSLAVQSIEIIAQKDQNSANTGTIWVGWTSTNGAPRRPMAAGDTWSIAAPFGSKLDLGAIYVDVANNGDGVTFTAIP